MDNHPRGNTKDREILAILTSQVPGTNVCVPQILMLKPNPQCDGLRR